MSGLSLRFRLFVRTNTVRRQLRCFTMHRSPKAMVSRLEPANVSVNTPRDPNTLSNYNNWITKHTQVEFKIDFGRQCVSGNVKLNLESITDAETKEIVLDTRYVFPMSLN